MKRNIVVIGASAGGVEALKKLVSHLPANFPAAVFAVLHIPSNSPSLLPQILNRAGQLVVTQPGDQTPIKYQHIYVAPPDHHMLLEKGMIRIIRGPKENRHRPAIDPLFRSAALIYGPQVIGIVLTGALDDGAAGLLAVKRQQGFAIVQDPKDALYPSMPESALKYVQADYCAPLADIASFLDKLVREEIPAMHGRPSDVTLKHEVEMAKLDRPTFHKNQPAGSPSAFSCPECGGVLWEIQNDTLMQYRCRIGHAFSPQHMQVAQAEKIEEALWTALKTLQEKASLTRYMQQQAEKAHQQKWSEALNERIEEIEKNVDILSDVLQSGVFSETLDQAHGGSHLGPHIDHQ